VSDAVSGALRKAAHSAATLGGRPDFAFSRTAVSLWIPGPMPGLNEMLAAARSVRGKGSAYATLKRQWGDVVWSRAQSAGLHRLGAFAVPVAVRFEWVERDRKRDPDNIRAGAKAILDGLVKAGVLAGDGWKHVAGLSDAFSVDAKSPGVRVTIEVAP
jgi:hypothetical protein